MWEAQPLGELYEYEGGELTVLGGGLVLLQQSMSIP